MSETIHKWTDISNNYKDGSIILGNGASIAVANSFFYSSLLDYAKNNHLSNDVQTLFDFFETSDFELILRLVWQASKVNEALSILDENKKTYEAYQRVRDSLIQSVRGVHPEHEIVLSELPSIYTFLKQFKTVLSLNYDLILYWTMMYGRDNDEEHLFKDCFVKERNTFDDNWERLRTPIRGYKSTTLVFYPHGSLILGRNVIGEEYKITSSNDSDLLNTILDKWKDGDSVPLFVSEGTSKHKLNSIHSSYYLSTVYWEVLTNIDSNLVIYGWNCGEQDEHILKAISRSQISSIAVSVYGDNKEYCNRVRTTLKKYLSDNNIEIKFFDSKSPGCWNNKKSPTIHPRRRRAI